MKKWLHKAFQDTAVGIQHPEPQGYAATERSSTHVLVEGDIAPGEPLPPPPTSLRRWRGSDPGVTNASAEHLPRGGHRPSRIFGPCATLAALARSGDGEPNSTARGLG